MLAFEQGCRQWQISLGGGAGCGVRRKEMLSCHYGALRKEAQGAHSKNTGLSGGKKDFRRWKSILRWQTKQTPLL